MRAVARYRVEHEVPGEIPGLGPEPADQRTRGDWRQAASIIGEVQKRLGRSVGRGHDRGAGLEV